MEKVKKVVMVDDNTDFLFTMETFLTRSGFEVFTADNGKDGLDLIRKELPDVILLDIMMETLYSGFEVCKRIRSDAELKEIPIIGISGMAEELNVKLDQWPDYRYFSPDSFLDKPVDKKELLSVIATAMGKAEEQQNRPKWRKDMDDKRKQEWADRV